MVFAQGELGSKVDDFLGDARPNSDRAPIDTLNDGGRFSQTQPQRGRYSSVSFCYADAAMASSGGVEKWPLIVDSMQVGRWRLRERRNPIGLPAR
jgi:hypothetical protein